MLSSRLLRLTGIISVVVLAIPLVMFLSACRGDDRVEVTQTQTEEQRKIANKLVEELRALLLSKYGFLIEFENIRERILRTNDPGHVEYVYVVSPFTGKIITKATAVGKVTSRSKRIAPSQDYIQLTVDVHGDSDYEEWYQIDRIQPDGAYGPSSEGLFWFDTSGQMFEVNVGGSVVITTERPYVFPDDTINLQVDLRLQGDIDPILDAQRIRIIEYIHNNRDWRPGDPIPEDVLRDTATPAH